MHHKKKHGDAGGGVNLSYIITPFLDMSFQLLAFFIMTYHPSALEGHIDGKLVPPTLVATKAKMPVDPMDIPSNSDPDAAETLIVKIKAVPKGGNVNNLLDGEPSMILIKQLQEERKVSEGEPLDIAMDRLKADLKAILNQPGAIKSVVKLDADGNLRHRYVMRVFDVCKQAGYANISFVAPVFIRPNRD